MKVLLINPGHDGSHAVHSSHRRVHRDPPPMSILVVGTMLKKMGVQVDILDTHIEQDWQGKLFWMLSETRYAWVGITVLIGKFMRNAAEITQFIKERFADIEIVYGGVMPTVIPGEMRKEYKPDMLVSGRMGALPAVDWTLLGNKINREQVPYYQMIMTSQGCPYDCSFCYNRTIGDELYFRDADDVCAELDLLHDTYGTTVFTMGDDNFLTKGSRAIAILEHCRRKGYYIEECIGHINNLRDDVIQAMGGVVQTFIFSIETASSNLQDSLCKKIDIQAVPDRLSWLREYGIVCNISFMIGLPGETDFDLSLNHRFMQACKITHPYIRGNSYLWLPLPGTPLSTSAAIPTLPIKEYEDANFWMHDKHDANGLKFRPHLTKERYEYLFDWGMQFNETFKYPEGHTFYVLDEVLNGNKPKLGGYIE